MFEQESTCKLESNQCERKLLTLSRNFYHSAARNAFVVRRIFATIQFVHNHLPNGVTSCRAGLKVAVAAMRHTEVHRVWPEWWIAQGSRDSWVVEERLLLHHCELIVATDSQIWRTETHDWVVSDVRVFLDYDSLSSHLFRPSVDCRIGPEPLVVIVSVWQRNMS